MPTDEMEAIPDTGLLEAEPLKAESGSRIIIDLTPKESLTLAEIVELENDPVLTRIQGSNFDDLWGDQKVLAQAAWDPRQTIEQGGLYKYVHGGEYHCYNPDVIATLQAAVRTGE